MLDLVGEPLGCGGFLRRCLGKDEVLTSVAFILTTGAAVYLIHAIPVFLLVGERDAPIEIELPKACGELSDQSEVGVVGREKFDHNEPVTFGKVVKESLPGGGLDIPGEAGPSI